MTKKRQTQEERIAQLRREPAFRALVDALREQEPDRLEAFSEWSEQAEREEADETGPRAEAAEDRGRPGEEV